ncbi:UNVERIFIED_CONTAM: hypothetical protein GTU68_026571 [Idotea baltica]|nr:hypothetical protein [Idotea baltica]
MKLEETFMHFLLKHQQDHSRTLNFLILMESILTAAKYIQYHYNSGALEGNLGKKGTTNIQGEKVMKLDDMANDIVMHYLRGSDQVIEATSEEVEDAEKMNEDGRYFIYFDPLDGSSNVKHSLPVGFMFGIAKRNLDGEEDCHLRKGKDFIAAGMFLIPSGIFTFALKDSGTWSFLMDKTGVFIRPEKITFPEDKKKWELSWNASHRKNFSDKVQKWVDENEANYSFRYAGALAIDFHRLLGNGGMFMYPAIVNHPDKEKNRPEGKLRLMYESAVVGFMAREAGGAVVTESGEDLLDLQPQDRHERSALYVGNKEVVSSIAEALRN